MKRLALLGLLAAGMTMLAGCPIFDDSPGSQNCFDNCGYGGSTPTTATGQCFQQGDCTGINETCGSDGFCHTGDCTLWGCVGMQTCQVSTDQKAVCADPIGHGGTGGATASGGASQGGAAQGGAAQGGAAQGGASSAGGTGGVTATGGTGGTGGVTATGGTGGVTASGGTGGSTKTGGTGGM
ncbi:MAG: hypothetical protein U0441_04175 [Polyangiaceae bacterium]